MLSIPGETGIGVLPSTLYRGGLGCIARGVIAAFSSCGYVRFLEKPASGGGAGGANGSGRGGGGGA